MTLKRITLAVLATLGLNMYQAQATGEIKQVPFTDVQVRDQFWKQRLDVMRGTTIRYAFQKCEDAGQLRNFEYAGKIVSGEAKVGELKFQSSNPYDDAEVYKVLEGDREPNLKTIRDVVKALRRISKPEDQLFIAIIAASTSLENVPKRIEINGMKVNVREYPVSTLEDAIIAAVHAEREGALGVVCAPIVAPTVEKILSIPVSRVIPTLSIQTAIEKLAGTI